MAEAAHPESVLGDLLTIGEVAARIHQKPATLAKWRTQGIGPRYLKVSGRCVLYPSADLDDWLQSKLVEANNEQSAGSRRILALPPMGKRPRVQRKHRLGGYTTKREKGAGDSGSEAVESGIGPRGAGEESKDWVF